MATVCQQAGTQAVNTLPGWQQNSNHTYKPFRNSGVGYGDGGINIVMLWLVITFSENVSWKLSTDMFSNILGLFGKDYNVM